MEKIKNVDLKVVGVTFKNEDTGEKRGEIIRELASCKKPQDMVHIMLYICKSASCTYGGEGNGC